MIRSGFKDLTEIVPTLKNINNSKSTVLFKAVDFIKYLEKRNKSLREKMKHLEVRVEVEGKMSALNHPPTIKGTTMKPSSIPTTKATNHNNTPSLPASIPQAPFHQTQAALLQHKTQQKQLMELQEKLQLHQRALAQKTHTFRFEKSQSKERESRNKKNNNNNNSNNNDSNNKLLKTTVSA
ncbi:hypothetical protein BD560DRAFT_387002 [Blakeslea trispora]|nr:hypothetical protein BD560DRAFT_387002 [Blakeslea trispora]